MNSVCIYISSLGSSAPRWLSFYGLILEIIGFIILAYDLIPEYRLSNLKNRLDGTSATLLHLLKTEKKLHGTDDLRQVAAAAALRIHEGHFLAVLRKAGLNDRKFFKTMRRLKREEIIAATQAIRAKLEKRESNLAARIRPPLYSGILLAIGGLALQLFGSWPC